MSTAIVMPSITTPVDCETEKIQNERHKYDIISIVTELTKTQFEASRWLISIGGWISMLFMSIQLFLMDSNTTKPTHSAYFGLGLGIILCV
jgi:hypothetical protein